MTEVKVKQVQTIAVFDVTLPLKDLYQGFDETKALRNARRRTKTELAAREIVCWKLLTLMNERVEQTEIAQWVKEQKGRATLCRHNSYINEARVLCHDEVTAMLFKLKFCGV